MKKLGLIVNPIAGMGGGVGLKGTDGPDILRRARELGAEPKAPGRATAALKVISQIKDQIELITCAGEMGESEAKEVGFSPTVIGTDAGDETSAGDTRRAAEDMAKLGVDLLLFAGGDGTARDVYEAVGQSVPALGIPVGVKMHSGVFALTPKKAGEAALQFLQEESPQTTEAEVMDIDEEAFRSGVVSAKLHGYLMIPAEPEFVQVTKSGEASEADALQSIAAEVAGNMESDAYYIIGPGTTTRAIKDELGIEGSLLGVDVVRNGELVAKDVAENELLTLLNGSRAKIIVTVIGGQGYIFGRGNQQLSPQVIRKVGKDNIIVVATRNKLFSLERRPLLVDTGDDALDESLAGYINVVTGFKESHVYKVGF